MDEGDKAVALARLDEQGEDVLDDQEPGLEGPEAGSPEEDTPE
jgi:hypothetical protein